MLRNHHGAQPLTLTLTLPLTLTLTLTLPLTPTLTPTLTLTPNPITPQVFIYLPTAAETHHTLVVEMMMADQLILAQRFPSVQTLLDKERGVFLEQVHYLLCTSVHLASVLGQGGRHSGIVQRASGVARDTVLLTYLLTRAGC